MTNPSRKPGQVHLRPYDPADRDWVLAEHLWHYGEVEEFDSTFPDAVERALNAFGQSRAPARSRAFILETAGRPIGCVFCFEEDRSTARIRLFYLEPSSRGRGLGALLLDQVLQHARESGFSRVVVSTFDRHAAACALYHDRGFRSSSGEAVSGFGHQLVKLDFQLDLI